METTIRKFGNSKGAIIPAVLLKKLGLDINDKVDAKEEDGRLIIEPIKPTKFEYSLDELLSKCSETAMMLNDEDRAWLDGPDVGREVV